MIAGKEKKVKRVIPGKIKTQLRLDGYYNVLNKYGTQHDSTEFALYEGGIFDSRKGEKGEKRELSPENQKRSFYYNVLNKYGARQPRAALPVETWQTFDAVALALYEGGIFDIRNLIA